MTYSECRKKNNCQTRILYLTKLFFKNEGKIKAFSDKQRLSKFAASRSVLQDTLKEGVLQEKTTRKQHKSTGKNAEQCK